MAIFALADFDPYLGQTFDAHAGDGTVPLVLIAAEPLRPGEPDARPAFSLLFRGPHTPLLPQGTYPFAHPRFEDLAIFIVPVGRDATSVQYEAIFN